MTLRERLNEIKDEIKHGPLWIEAAYARILLVIADEAITKLENRATKSKRTTVRSKRATQR